MDDRLVVERCRALYDMWSSPVAVGAVENRTQQGSGFQEAWREATVALGAALGVIDIENPITTGEDR